MKKSLFTLIVFCLFLSSKGYSQFTIAASGPTQFCSGSGVSLVVSSLPAGNWVSFEWKRSNINCYTLNFTTFGFSSMISTGLTGLYVCFATSDLGVQISSNNAIMVRSLPATGSTTLLPAPQSAAVTCVSSADLCAPNIYNQEPVQPVLRWYKNNVLIPGATLQAYTATTSGYYKYQIVAACNSPFSDSILVTIGSSTTQITAAGPLVFCQGGNVSLSAATGIGYTYVWKKDGVTITGETASVYVATTGGNYTCVVNNPSCGALTSNALNVIVNSLPVVSFSGLAATYTNVSPSVTLTGSPAGGTFTGPGITGNIFNPASAGTGTHTITYSYTNGNGCMNNSSANTTVTLCTAPARPASVAGTLTPCAGNINVAYSCPAVSGATSYTWTVPANTSIASGQGTNAITINFNASYTSGVISVVANNCGGSSLARAINVYGKPNTPGAVTGIKSEVCPGLINVSYSIASVGGAASYTWTPAVNSTIVSGQGSTSILCNFNSSFSTGNLSVSASNVCGTSAIKTVTLRALPTVPSSITGPLSFCSNQQAVAYSTPAVTGATTYNWLVPIGATVATGQGTNAITVNFGIKNGKVKVNAGNACGTSAYKQITVTKTCREAFQPDKWKSISVFPNPSNGDFILEFPEIQENSAIVVSDVTGRIIIDEKILMERMIIADEQLLPGIYSVIISDSKQRSMFKIVKVK
jgi:hypothetical protein